MSLRGDPPGHEPFRQVKAAQEKKKSLKSASRRIPLFIQDALWTNKMRRILRSTEPKIETHRIGKIRWVEVCMLRLCRRRAAFRQSRSASRLGLQNLLYIRDRRARTTRRLVERRQFLAFDQHADLVRIQSLSLQQRSRHSVHCILMCVQNAVRRAVSFVDKAANLSVDLPRRLLGEIAMLRDLASKKDLLFLLAEGQRTQSAHAVFANHLACEVSRPLDIVAGSGC